jgi:peptidoglycan/LPS O-acetylase OafA/YrhL
MKVPGRPLTERRFRPEIEGLRAVAAVLIAVYHVYLGRVSGGVDVFFVVAGFLVVGSLLGRAGRTGRVEAAAYLSRLARRLLPNALLVLALVLVATVVWLPGSRRSPVFWEVGAAAVYAENWALMARSVDYLAREEAASPVQHFWAMSVQGQFYVLALLAVLLVWTRRWPAAVVRRRLVVLLVPVALVSFAFSVWLTEVNQPVAYFHTGARLWEFAVGALLALAVPLLPTLPRGLRVVTGWVGLGMILVCGLVFPVSTTFPGWIALWPVLGAVLVVLSGGTGVRWSADGLLGSRPLVYVGGVSYGLYLWHWPLLVFYLQLSGRQEASFLGGLAVIAAAFGLSVLSTTLVELPIRRRAEGAAPPRRSSLQTMLARRTVLVGASCSALVAGVAVASSSATAIPPVAAVSVAAADPVYPGALAMTGELPAPPETEPVPSLTQVLGERGALAELGCHQGLDDPEVVLCEAGAVDGPVTVMLAGGSHSAHWYPALEPLADTHGWRLVTATKSSCLFLTDAEDFGLRSSCEEWNDALLTRIEVDPPDLVVMTSTRGEGEAEHVPPHYLRRWAELDALGVPVLAIRDTPRGTFDRPECQEVNGVGSPACDVPRSSVLASSDPTAALGAPPDNVTFLDLSDYLCDADSCPAVIGNVQVYSDRHHLTTAFAGTLSPVLEPQVVHLLGVDG